MFLNILFLGGTWFAYRSGDCLSIDFEVMFYLPTLYQICIRLDKIHSQALIKVLILLLLIVPGADPDCLVLVLRESD